MRNFLNKIEKLQKELSLIENPRIYLYAIPSYNYENVIIKIVTKQKGTNLYQTTTKKIYEYNNLIKEYETIKQKIKDIRNNV